MHFLVIAEHIQDQLRWTSITTAQHQFIEVVLSDELMRVEGMIIEKLSVAMVTEYRIV